MSQNPHCEALAIGLLTALRQLHRISADEVKAGTGDAQIHAALTAFLVAADLSLAQAGIG